MKRLAPLLIIALLLTGQGCGGPSKADVEATKPVTIKIWRVFDGSETFRGAMDAYRKIHPNVSFDYRTLRYEEYEDELIRGFATGTGPDIFSVHNTWMGEYMDLITPLPASLEIPYSETKGTLKKETVTTIKVEPSISQREVREEYLDVIPKDTIRSWQPDPRKPAEDRIMGLVMGMDTLALYYNRDLLNAAGIATPPSTWDEFLEDVKLLTRVNEAGSIVQSGAAIGTSDNVERPSDILSVLMMQSGANMTTEGRVTFATEVEGLGMVGANALRFYTDFANPVKEVYTWNAEQPEAFEAFTSGSTAFFFGYTYHLPLIKARAPKLNLGTTGLPQISGGRTVNYANYWVEVVSKASENQKWAWDFLQFATSEEQVQSYLSAAKKPTARRALINEQLANEDLAEIYPFVDQLLTVDSWYQGNDASIMEEAFTDMIDGVLAGDEIEETMRISQGKVAQTY